METLSLIEITVDSIFYSVEIIGLHQIKLTFTVNDIGRALYNVYIVR